MWEGLWRSSDCTLSNLGGMEIAGELGEECTMKAMKETGRVRHNGQKILLKFLDLSCLDFVGLESVEVKFSQMCLFYFILCGALHCVPLHFNKAANMCKNGDWSHLLSLH